MPRLLDPATLSERAATTCFDAAVNAHLRAASPPGRPRRSRTPTPEGLRAVFAAHVLSTDATQPSPTAHASAFRAPGAEVTYLCAGHRSPRSRTWFATTLHPPARPAVATWQRFEPSGEPGGGISHFYGHAHPDVAAVMIRTPDGTEHHAPVAGGIWWTAAWLDETTTGRTAARASWRAVAGDGELLASGTGLDSGAAAQDHDRPAGAPTRRRTSAPPGLTGAAATDAETTDAEPVPPTDPALLPVLRELQAREPLFHRRELGTSTEDLQQQIAPEFFEVGASGRRYDRRHVIDVLTRRYAESEEEPWHTCGFHCRALSQDTYLLTYDLHQGRRRTRRMTLWRRTPQGWQVLYHQGTPIT